MAGASVILDNNVEFNLKNGNEIDLDFSFDQFSPNPSFVSPFVMQFVCTPSENPIEWFEGWINANSIAASPSANILKDSLNLAGQAKLSSSQNTFIRNQGQNSEFNILFEPFGNNFFDKSKSLPLSNFIQPSKNDEGTPIIRYVTERNSKLEDFIFLVVTTQFAIEAAQQLYNIFDAIKEAVSSGFDSVSAAIKTILKVAMNLIYAAAIIIALTELLKQASEILFDKPKKLYALDVWSTIQKGCQFLGYEFESTLTQEFAGLTYLVATTTPGETFDEPKNDPIPSFTLFDFIERISLLFRGKLKVTQDKIILENEDYYELNPSDVVLSELYENGAETYNFEELPEFINVEYQKVQGDNNFIDNKYGVQFSLNSSFPNRNFGVENKIDIKLPYALGQRKTEQSTAEIIFNSIFDIFAGISKSYKVSLGDRLNFLKLEQDIVQSDTIFIRNGEKIAENSNELLQAKTLYNNYYNNASPLNAQFVTVTDRGKDRICKDDTNKLINNNIAKDSKGRTIVITKNIRGADNANDIEYKRRLFDGDFGYMADSFFNVRIVSDVNNI